MVIHFGESQILKWQVPQALHRAIGRKFSRAHLLKQFPDGIGVQEKLSVPRVALRPGTVANSQAVG